MPQALSNQTVPLTTSRPLSGRVSPASMRNRVVLPAPEAPNRAMRSPGVRLAVTLSVSGPWAVSSCLARSISITGHGLRGG